MEDNGKSPERGNSYEQNAMNKKLLEKKITKNYNHQDKITLIPSSLMRKPILQTYDRLVLKKNKREEDMANRWNNNPCYRGKNIERYVKKSGSIKGLKCVYHEPCVQCSEEHVENNMR